MVVIRYREASARRRPLLPIAGCAREHAHVAYRVVRRLTGVAYTEVSLVRDGGEVVFGRRFRPMLELNALEGYSAELERVAQHANAGTLGCFVHSEALPGGRVAVSLYERWFDGAHLRCDRLERREFDAGDDDALVASSEYVGLLRARGAQEDERRQASYRDARLAEESRVQDAAERSEAAAELARILEGTASAE